MWRYATLANIGLQSLSPSSGRLAVSGQWRLAADGLNPIAASTLAQRPVAGSVSAVVVVRCFPAGKLRVVVWGSAALTSDVDDDA